MNAKGTTGAILLLAGVLLAGPRVAPATELQSVLVRTSRGCWNDFRAHALGDSGVAVTLLTGERLTAHSWLYGRDRRAIRLWLDPGTGDSTGVRPPVGAVAFEYRRSVRKKTGPRLIGVLVGAVAGGALGAASVGGPTTDSGSLHEVFAAAMTETARTIAVGIGAVLGATAGFVVGGALAPRVTEAGRCDCVEATPLATGGAVGGSRDSATTSPSAAATGNGEE